MGFACVADTEKGIQFVERLAQLSFDRKTATQIFKLQNSLSVHIWKGNRKR